MTTSHSAKGSKTIEMMGSEPGAWKHADIEWRWEERTIMGRVTCPVCKGTKYVTSRRDRYEVVERPADVTPFNFINSYSRDNGLHSTECRNCYVRGWMNRGTVRGLVTREMWVGYPVWPKGTSFASRFQDRDCHLCSKALKVHVPCVGVSRDGKPLGMWVGTDCAKKFLPGVHTKLLPNNAAENKGADYLIEKAADAAA